MNDELTLDKRVVRRSFDKAAATYDASAVLQQEIGERMLSRLDYIKQKPSLILDAGTGTGGAVPGLRSRYPQARLCVLDIALAMVQRAQARVSLIQRLRGRSVWPACGDIERLPLRDAVIDLIWSNLTLQWTNEPHHVFQEFHRVLVPEGLVMFSTFGPDTLKELRAAYQNTDRYTHVNRFVDMHDLGDMLVHAGFADPVMDMEYMTLTYPDVRALMRELKAIGAHNTTAGRRPGMTARAVLAAVERNYETWRSNGRLPATFEIVYGHAWKPKVAKQAGGPQVVQWYPKP